MISGLLQNGWFSEAEETFVLSHVILATYLTFLADQQIKEDPPTSKDVLIKTLTKTLILGADQKNQKSIQGRGLCFLNRIELTERLRKIRFEVNDVQWDAGWTNIGFRPPLSFSKPSA
jgi:hypothetical protein